MRFLVISDVHANLVAFETVLEAAQNTWDEVLFLGDLVGYGPDPNECVALMQTLPHRALIGNHDLAALKQMDIDTFNSNARQAMKWTQKTLTPASKNYLASLMAMFVDEPLTCAHASPRNPVWEYVSELDVAAENFDYFDTQTCLVGHTHVPVVFVANADGAVSWRKPVYGEPLKLIDSSRFLINPGSVGQPRDTDPRAAYAILDAEAMTFTHFRVAYDIAETQVRMLQHRLPPALAARLEYGF